MRKLLDLNVWLALSLDRHPQHAAARRWLQDSGIQRGDLLFCLPTEMGLLRLLTQEATMKAFGLAALTNEEAIAFVHSVVADPDVGRIEPPAEVHKMWLKAASRRAPSPGVWMDAYLAALSMSLGAEMVTFDTGFKEFTKLGLHLRLLSDQAPRRSRSRRASGE